MTTITIDPGHGQGRAGKSTGPGVRGRGGTLEKDVMLDLAHRLQRRLGARAALTRVSDANISLAARTQAARGRGSGVFLSLHANQGGRGERGAEMLIHTRAGAPSLALARSMQASLARLGAPDLGIKRAELAVLTPEQLPAGAAACLVEVDYLSDPAGEARLRDPRALDALSAALAAGVERYLDHPPRYGRPERASVGVALAVPDWDRPAKFPAKIAAFWAGKHHRLLHEYWHAIRQKGWAGLTASEQTDAAALGFSDPGRTRTDPGWGVDFFCMHRHMIETTRAAAKKLGGSYKPTGWDPVPWDHNDKVWPMPAAPSFASEPFKQKGPASTPWTTDYWKGQLAARYNDDDWLSKIGLDDLGKEVEGGFHGWLHMHWSTDPPADPKDVSVSNDWLGTFFSSHVNPIFWKLHGWVDALIDRWELAPTRAKQAANKGARRDASALFATWCWEGKMPMVPASLGLMIDGGHGGDADTMVMPMPGVDAAAEPLTDEQLDDIIARLDLDWNHFPFVGMSVEEIDRELGLDLSGGASVNVADADAPAEDPEAVYGRAWAPGDPEPQPPLDSAGVPEDEARAAMRLYPPAESASVVFDSSPKAGKTPAEVVEQQQRALIGTTSAAEVFDDDVGFGAQLREIAERTVRARLNDVDETDARVATDTDAELARLRGVFINYGGRVLFVRSIGRAALKRLQTEENALVARLQKQKQSVSQIQQEVWELRNSHFALFVPDKALVKQRFLETAEMEHRFSFEAQNASRNYGGARLTAPADGAETIHSVPVAGLVAGEDAGSGIGDSVVRFIRELKKLAALDAYTYPRHGGPGWGRNVIDVEPRIARDDRGYYDLDAVATFGDRVEQVAQAEGLRWMALYTDFEAARRINETIGERRVHFQWEHGPHPYVLHIHFYIVPV